VSPGLARRILIDTGPIVAIFSKQDRYHQACVETVREVKTPLYTCWPVITEAAWLLRVSPPAVQRMLSLADGSLMELLPLTGMEARTIASLMKRYETLRPQLADACLMYLAEREGIETIFTMDRRDFSVLRTRSGRALRLIPEIE